MKTTIEWTRADEGLPHDGACVLAAVTGRYPVDPDDDHPDSLSGREFWLVLPVYFRHRHVVEETGEVVVDCFRDSDDVVRLPRGGATDEVVTHWAGLPDLPGADVSRIIGVGVGPALRAASADGVG